MSIGFEFGVEGGFSWNHGWAKASKCSSVMDGNPLKWLEDV
jgi:hypothetical protein